MSRRLHPVLLAAISLLAVASTGGFTVLASGAAVSNSVIVQCTTNLAPPIIWLPLQTNVIGGNKQIRFTEANLNVSPVFYRLQIP